MNQNNNDRKDIYNNGMTGVVYFLAVTGAAIYNIQHTATFWGGVVGFLKALVWPLFVMYKVFELLKM